MNSGFTDMMGLLVTVGGVVAVVVGVLVGAEMLYGADPAILGLVDGTSIAGFPLVGRGVLVLLIVGSGMVGLGGLLRR